ncbi:MAG: nucleotidyltransferase family protein [Ignavibacteriae bacterium]|nr:nucleotidyltransferase family protein [Ignavibacteriota bacterium]
MNISALILAAGSGSRIGTPKLMLEINGKSFIRVIIDRLKSSGIKNIVCVVSEKTYEWTKKNIVDCKIVVNPEPEEGMISSVFYGMKRIDKCNGVIIVPVDHPYVETDTYKFLMMESKKNIGAIVKPRFVGKTGHPIIIPYELANKISENKFSTGLDKVIKKSGYKQVCIDIQDIGILKNINKKEDFING